MDDKPVSILVVGTRWPPETFLARLFKGWLEAGLQVTIASSSRPKDKWLTHPNFIWLQTATWNRNPLLQFAQFTKQYGQKRIQKNVDLSQIRLKMKQKQKGSKLRAWNRLLPFAGGHWDIIYCPWAAAMHPYLSIVDQSRALVVSNRGSHINVAPHNPERERVIQRLKVVFEKATAVHCVSEDIKQAASEFSMELGKARVIRPAIDPKFFTIPVVKQQQEQFRLITTGSLIWRKGYEYVLMTIRHLLDAGIPVHFEIIGDGPERLRLLYTIQDLALTEYVTWHGRLTPKEVRDHLQQADAFLLSSLSEGISNAVLEAMGCGLPIVSTDVGGMCEAITNGKEGYLVPPRDPQAMAARLQTLWEDPALRQRMGQAARQRVCYEFSLEDQITQFIGLFQKILMEKEVA